MYFCAVHASVHDYVRQPGIRLLLDIVLLSRQRVNWTTVLRYAYDDGYENRLMVTLYLAKHLLDADIPEYIISKGRMNHRMEKALQMVLCGSENGAVRLRDSLSKMGLLKVEALLDDRNILNELFGRLFPPRIWLQKKYRDKSVAVCYFRHLACIIHHR